MNDETYQALIQLMHHATYGGPNDASFWSDVKIIEGWIKETAKDHEDIRCCNRCGDVLRVEDDLSCGYHNLIN